MKLCASCHNGFYGGPDHCPVCGADLSDDAEITGHELEGMAVGDRYELVELLGEGAMGWVYRGLHQALERSVAIKLLKTVGEAQPEQIARFEQEARAISRLHHPHIVSVIDFGRTPGGIFYLVTEYVEGTTLADALAETGMLSLSRTLGVFHQIMAAVEEAHSAHVIHRDLKPDNIVITPLRSGEDFVKVLDFGIAMLSDDKRPRMTAQGATVGTPGFMAPETIMEGRSTERSDIYALGNILYEMLTGGPPFDHDWPMALLSMHLNDEPTPLCQAAPDAGYPPELERVVGRAMAKLPEDRYASVAELRAELLEAFHHVGRMELDCHRCSRPRDPDTGLCTLHGSSPTSQRRHRAPESTVPPISTPSPVPSSPPVDVTSSTLIQQAALNRGALVERVRGTNAAGLQAEAEAMVDYLLSPQPLLEVAGEQGTGRARLLRGLGSAAESLGLRVLRLSPDPRRAHRPWYPVRRLVGALLDSGPEPDSIEPLTRGAHAHGLDREHLVGLSLLFGFSHPDAPERWFERAKLIRRAAGAVIAATDEQRVGTCVIAEDVLDYDRASQGFVRTLPRRLAGGHSKLAIGSDGAFWPTRKDRALIRPGPADAADVAALIEQAGISEHTDTPSLARRVAEVAQGNPLHAQQAILALAEGRELDGALPDLLRWRLRQLPAEATQLLRVVCALGWEVDLQDMAELVDDDVKLLATDLLLRRSLLVAGPGRNLSPVHATLARAVLATLTRDERSELHQTILAQLERRGASVFLRAHHAYEAELGEPALDLLVEAGDEACRWSDVETAALVHYRRAAHVARWRLLWSEEDERFLELSLKMADALRSSGHSRAAEVVFKEILGSSKRHPSIRDRAETGLSTLRSA